MLLKLVLAMLFLISICVWTAGHFIDETRKENARIIHRIEKGEE